MSSQQVRPRLFISYSNKDVKLVEKLAAGLEESGIDVSYDANLTQIGSKWQEDLDRGLASADGVVVLLTPASVLSDNVMSELQAARVYSNDPEHPKLLLPVVYNILTIPDVVKNIQSIIWRDGEDYHHEVVAQIARAVHSFMDKREGSAPPTQSLGRGPAGKVKPRPVQPKNPDSSAVDTETKYWFLKMNPETWQIEHLEPGEETFFSSYFQKMKRPEYDLIHSVKPGDQVIGFGSGQYQSVMWLMEVTRPVGPDEKQGEIFHMKIFRSVEPRIPLEDFKNKIPEIVPHLQERKRPPSLLFSIKKETYEQILSAGTERGTAPVFVNTFQPFYLTEGDHSSTKDQLDFENDIDSFASVIALKKVVPPLAIGLFGHWGSGKSFFMEKLIESIHKKADSTDEDYVRNVVQVKFNSWHYSDSNLWASLITEIFDSLSRYTQEKKAQDELKKLSETLQFTSIQKEAMEEKRRELEARINNLENEKKEKRERLEDLSGIALVKMIVSDEKIAKDLSELNNENVEEITGDLNKLNKYQQEIKSTGSTLSYYFKLLRNLKGWRWPLIIAVMMVVFAACYLIPHFYPDWWQGITFEVSGIVSVLVAFFSNALALIKPVKKNIDTAFGRLESMKKTLDERPQAETPELEKNKQELAELKTSLQAIDEKIKTTRTEIDDIVSGKQLIDFIENRTRDENYTKQLGMISWIRKDFNKLDELLRKQHDLDDEDKKLIDNPNQVKLKIDRIVLYIDDLDRCNKDIVVKVLEAIHLLLAFPLFVVVVGVDPRWLNNALSEKYKVLFGAGKKNGKNKDGGKKNKEESLEEAELFLSGIATSYDYLEKIFQIPFTLKLINKDGREKLIKYLIRNELQEETKEVQTNPSDREDAEQNKKGEEENANEENEEKKDKKNEEAEKLKQQEEKEEKEKEKEKKVKQRLVFSQDELEYMQKLSALFGKSPRSINRYVNIYRIIKAHKGMKVVGDFSRDEFIPIMFTLGVVVGYSVFAQDFIDKLTASENGQSLKAFMSSSGLNDKLIKAITPFTNDEIGGMPIENFKRNLGLISRFSFRTLLKE